MILLLEIIVYAMAAVGVLAVLLIATWAVCVLWHYTMRCSYNHLERYGKSWVIVTGATDGVGLAFAKFFYHLGFSILAVGKDSTKLEALSNDIWKYGGDSKVKYEDLEAGAKDGFIKDAKDKSRLRTVTFDFTDANKDLGEAVLAEINKDKLDVSILINTVGHRGFVGAFEKQDAKSILEQLRVNAF